MENFSSSMFLLVAITAIIIVYNSNSTNRFLHKSIQDIITLLKQTQQDWEQIKLNQKSLLNALYYLTSSKEEESKSMDVNELEERNLLEQVVDIELNSKTLTPYIEQEVSNGNSYFEEPCKEYKETISCCGATRDQILKNQIKLKNEASYYPCQHLKYPKSTVKEVRFQEIANRELILNKIVKKIRNSLEIETILETVVEELYSLFQLDRCVFAWHRFDASSPHWELVQEANDHQTKSFIKNCVSVVNLFDLSEKISNREIINVVDTKNLSNPVEQEFFRFLGYSSVLLMPVHTRSGEIGIVNCVHSDKQRFWSEREVELLSAVIEQLTIALDQAELYQQSRIATAKAQKQAATFEKALHKLQQEQSQIIQSEKMLSLGQLVAGIAHEVNNPINFISGNLTYASEYSQYLLNLIQLYTKHYPKPAEEIKAESEKIDLNFIQQDLPKIIGSMETGAARIRKTILSLRNFSRLDEAEMKAVDLHEGIDNTLLILTHRLETNNPDRPNIQLIKDYGQLPLVQCYARALNQVFMNIISNAIDAIEDYTKKRSFEHQSNYSGTILISTQVFNSKQVIILIGDNGSGMSPAIASRIFDPFFTTKPVGSATGLGMSITYKIIVEQHQGEIQCISAPEKGTALLIQIPIYQHSKS